MSFPVTGTNAVLFAVNRAAQEGTLDFSSPKKLEYRFEDSFFVPQNASLVIEYEIIFRNRQTPENENYSLGFNTGGTSWQLPLYYDTICFYAIPVENVFEKYFSISVDPDVKIDKASAPVFKILSVGLTERFFGFSGLDSGSMILSPFIYRQDSSYVIDVPETWRSHPFNMDIEASFIYIDEVKIEFAGNTITAFPDTKSLYIPSAMYPAAGQVILTGEGIMSFKLNPAGIPDFPHPVKADPALVIEWSLENWRTDDYEVFCWDRFPSILIFDFTDYEAQDRMLKRLAFFAEKTGFRGRLAYDSEISGLHGWNAHDYRAQDLASFFDTARKTDFPLLNEERDLEQILLNEGIIIETKDGIVSGEGAVISISRESPDYLRWRFMAHEGFHGLFFIDEEFRDFTKRRWEQLHVTAKRFILSFFNYQQYDTSDEYLLLNEFMAHVLQQSVPNAADYFGSQLPLRLENTWRASDLPKKDETSNSWSILAEAFTAEAENFTNYVNKRWGIAAGRVWTLRTLGG